MVDLYATDGLLLGKEEGTLLGVNGGFALGRVDGVIDRLRLGTYYLGIMLTSMLAIEVVHYLVLMLDQCLE